MRHCIFFLLFLFLSLPLTAQSDYVIDNSSSEITVQGTSNVHDWHMVVKKLNGGFKGVIDQSQLKSISSGSVECLAADLKSDSKMMDGKALDALNGDDFPKITFVLSSLTNHVSNGMAFTCIISGNLTVAGKTNAISIPFNGSIDSKGSIQLDGTAKITMSQFSIDPPTAMFGAISCGDPLTLAIKIKFVPVK